MLKNIVLKCKDFYFSSMFLYIPVGKALSPAKKTSYSGNPWASVLISWFLVQVSEDECGMVQSANRNILHLTKVTGLLPKTSKLPRLETDD